MLVAPEIDPGDVESVGDCIADVDPGEYGPGGVGPAGEGPGVEDPQDLPEIDHAPNGKGVASRCHLDRKLKMVAG